MNSERSPTTSAAPAPAVACHDVRAAYGGNLVLEGVDFALQPGITCLVGRNGAGKTTLFRALAGILRPAAGEVRILGGDPFTQPWRKQAVGYLTHRPSLHQRLTVEDNLRFWSRVLGLDWQANAPHLDRLATRFGLASLFGRPAGKLSRGQQQRVAIARMLLAQPPIVLMDEPSTGLDALAIRELHSLVLELAADGVTVLYATHAIDEAVRLGGSFLLLANRTALPLDRPLGAASDPRARAAARKPTGPRPARSPRPGGWARRASSVPAPSRASARASRRCLRPLQSQ